MISIPNPRCAASGQTGDIRPDASGRHRALGADITLARERLGFAPQFDLEAGLKKTVEFYRESAGR